MKQDFRKGYKRIAGIQMFVRNRLKIRKDKLKMLEDYFD